ncbi:unnamed protein product, partial [Rotaria magnacalcarata]
MRTISLFLIMGDSGSKASLRSSLTKRAFP